MPIGKITRIPVFDKNKKPRYFAFIDDKYFFHVSQFKGVWKELIELVAKGPVLVKFEEDTPGPNNEQRAKDVEIVL